jgi:hypothetical protein
MSEEIPVGENVFVPIGEWVDVPVGMVAAPGTYVDREGTLRIASNDSIALWHNRVRSLPPCPFVAKTKDDIVYDPETGAPWCPVCFEQNRVKAIYRANSANPEAN